MIKVGVCNANNLNSFVFDDINGGIDLTFENYIAELESQDKTEEEIRELTEQYDNDNRVVLFGDWIKVNGKYEPDKTKDFAAVYDNESNIITVEWSKHIKLCAETSPCYVMSDGSGRCGDLDSEGTTVTAYSLPIEYFKKEGGT